MLKKKDPKIKYTTMAMWVDANSLTVDRDSSDGAKMYEYITQLAYMLSKQRKFFKCEEDYESFSYYVASSIFMRITNPRTRLDKDNPNYLTPITSVLNYLKDCLYGRKCNFIKTHFREVTEDDATSEQSVAYRSYILSGADDHRTNNIRMEVSVVLASVTNILLNELRNGVYGKDKILCHKLYVSTLITLLRNFTLSNKNKERLSCWEKSGRGDFDALLSNMMVEESESAPIVYDLSEEYLPYIKFIASKVKTTLASEIKNIIQEYTVSDEMASDILLSEYQSMKVGDESGT